MNRNATSTDVDNELGETMIVEKDIAIPLRNGAILRADLFRSDSHVRVPAIMNAGMYYKDKVWVPPD